MADVDLDSATNVALGHLLALWVWADWPLDASVVVALLTFGLWVALDLIWVVAIGPVLNKARRRDG